MTEANNNANPLNFASDSESWKLENSKQKDKVEASSTANEFSYEDKKYSSDMDFEQAISQNHNLSEVEQGELCDRKMNWQKVAHKLREYNRKLLKKVFRLEQELADVENKFTKCVEKSKSSDILVAQQEQEIRKYQEEIELFDSQKVEFQEIIKQKEIAIANLYEQYELSQQQTAQLERDCALLQENYNHKLYELTTKDKEIRDIQNKLSQQQRSALQYKAELKRYQEQSTRANRSTFNIPTKEPVIPKRKSHSNQSSNQRTIQPWSTASVAETKITIPKAKASSIPTKKTNNTETVKTAAKIATWSASQTQESKVPKPKNSKISTSSQPSTKVKPKSLAAVDLPTFPRPV